MRSSLQVTLIRQIVTVAILLLPFSAHCADDSVAAIPKPEIKIGDRWTYRMIDYRTNQERLNVEDVATFVGPDLVITVATNLASKKEYDAHWTPEWNAISLASGEVYKEPRKFFQFPLSVGQNFETVYERVATKGSMAKYKNEATVKVASWEQIEVPAGKFRALRIEVQGNWQRLDARGSGWMKHTFWYVAEVKRWVKYVFENGIPQPWESLGFELLDFQVK